MIRPLLALALISGSALAQEAPITAAQAAAKARERARPAPPPPRRARAQVPLNRPP